MSDGEIFNEEAFKQQVLFSGMVYHRRTSNIGISPTDIDLMLELNGNFCMAEIKKEGTYLTTGQKILFKNMAEMCRNSGKQFVAFYCTHNEPAHKPVLAAYTKVKSYLSTYNSDFTELEKEMTLDQAIQGWMAKYNLLGN